MPVVSNTSPLLNLAIVSRPALLREQFGEIWVPPAVVKRIFDGWLTRVCPERPKGAGAEAMPRSRKSAWETGGIGWSTGALFCTLGGMSGV